MMLAASSWGVIVDVAAGVLAVLVLGVLRATWKLSDRVSRLEGIEQARRRCDE